MTVRILIGAIGACAIVGSASAAVTETSIFRQLASRARGGSFSTPTVDQHNNTNEIPGLFNDSQVSQVSGAGASSATAQQNTTVTPGGLYFGSIRADAAAAGNSGGTSDSSCSYGPVGSSFQTTFSVGFTVDAPTLAHFAGSAVATRTNSTGSIICQAILGDVLNGSPQPATLFAQPTANAPMVSWDQLIMLQPGHLYSFTATVNASQSNTFSSTSGAASSLINFDIAIPAPASGSVLALAALGLRRRRR
jgi:hypothetical protein